MAGGIPDEESHLTNGYDHPRSGYDLVQKEEREMPNIDEEHELQHPPPNGNAQGQEENPESRCLSTFSKYTMKILIGIICILLAIICVLIIICVKVPGRSNHQKDAIKCLPVTCPPDWIGYQGHCYYFSREEKNWNESLNFCLSHSASLAKITNEEMDFVMKLIRKQVFWIGLKGEPGQPWKWLDGENAMMKVMGNGAECAFLTDDGTASAGRCSTEHRYICKKN